MYGLKLVDLEHLEGPTTPQFSRSITTSSPSVGPRLRELVSESGVIYDIKGCLPRDVSTARL